MKPSTGATAPLPKLAGLDVLAAVGLFVLLWAALNAGPPTVDELRQSPISGRAYLPLLAGALVIPWLARRIPRSRVVFRSAPALLAGYAAIGVVSSLTLSPQPVVALYWALAFLGIALVCLRLMLTTRGAPRPLVAMQFGQALAVLLCLMFFCIGLFRFDLASELAGGHFARVALWPSYVGEAFGANANGVGRFASITLLLAAGNLFNRKSRLNALWLTLVLVAASLLIFTISRSAIVGLVAAASVLIFLRFGGRVLVGVVTAGLAALAFGAFSSVRDYLVRGQSSEQFLTLTGRTETWAQTWQVFLSSPLIGRGFQADRFVVGQHVHNAFLEALVQTGLVGTAFFVAAWVVTIRALYRLGVFRRFAPFDHEVRRPLIAATVMLVFFTIRGLVESSGAFFGVDTLFVIPAMAHIQQVHSRASMASVPRDQGARPKVLVSAYACAPPSSASFAGGEELLGWKLSLQLARGNDVWALISAEHEQGVREALERDPVPSFHPIFVRLTPGTETWTRRQGAIQLYAYLWQMKAFVVALRLHRAVGFDAFHHLTYANDWMASHIGALLPVEYIRGPGGGAQRVPRGFLESRRLSSRRAEILRRCLQNLLRLDPFFLWGQWRARVLLVCNREALHALSPDWAGKAILFPVNGIDGALVTQPNNKRPNAALHVISVGKLLPIKGFDLALRAFSTYLESGRLGRMTIVGDGPERAHLQSLAMDLGIAARVEFAGWKPHAETLQLMSSADVLLFPSLRDGGGAVVVEAMAAGAVPIVFDLAGPAMHVTPDVGFAVPAISPSQALDDMAKALLRLADNRALWSRLSTAGRERARRFYLWNHLGDWMGQIYGRHVFSENIVPASTGSFLGPHSLDKETSAESGPQPYTQKESL